MQTHLYFVQIWRQVINESQKRKKKEGRKEREREKEKGVREGERKENRKEIESSWSARENQKRYMRKLSRT